MIIAAALLLLQPVHADLPFSAKLPLNPAAITAISLQASPFTNSAAATGEADSVAIAAEAPANSEPETGSFLPGMLEKTAAPTPVAAGAEAIEPAPQPIMMGKPQPANAARVSNTKWWLLSGAMHGAAAFDAYSTRRFTLNGTGRELNPVFAPFAGSPAIYAGTQVVPVVLDIVSRKMMHSESPVMRKFWWLPQSLAATSSFICATHNMTLH